MKSNEKTTFDSMPEAVATALLLSGQSQTNTFRKVCKTARERVCEPVSRSTRLNSSAPATPFQRFEHKLRKANAQQLTTWLRRATRRGERLQDNLFESQTALDSEPTIRLLERGIVEIDVIAQAIISELTSRSKRGKIKTP